MEVNEATWERMRDEGGRKKERANARERQLGKLFLPGFLQMIAVARRNGEEKFVVFAVGNSVVDLGAGK